MLVTGKRGGSGTSFNITKFGNVENGVVTYARHKTLSNCYIPYGMAEAWHKHKGHIVLKDSDPMATASGFLLTDIY